jgi:hypothetical protein
VEKIDCGCNDPRLEFEFHPDGHFVAIKGCPHREKPTHLHTAHSFKVEIGGAQFIVQAIPITLIKRQWEERDQPDTLSA